MAGCVAPAEDVGSQAESVQLDRHDFYYDVALAPSGAQGEASRATGAVFVPDLGPSPEYTPVVSGNNRLRYTCGVTFVSPYLAVTAAHCIDEGEVPDPETATLQVQMYRPTHTLDWDDPELVNPIGTFPNYTHDPLGPADGYFVDNYTCSVEARCGTEWGDQYNCEQPDLDVAILRCPDAPGTKYGYVNVAAAEEPSWPLVMPWKHEVYDIPTDPATDLFQHYSVWTSGNPAPNYHYFGSRIVGWHAGEEQNFLLPLIDLPFADGTPRSIVWPGTHETWTDEAGCHGTSGSGVMQIHPSNRPELLGPASHGMWASDRLCANPNGINSGEMGLSFASLTGLRAVLAEVDPCNFADRSVRPSLSRICDRSFFTCPTCPFPGPISEPPGWPWGFPDFDHSPWESLRISNEPVVDLAPGGTIVADPWDYSPGTPLDWAPGVRYRYSIRTVRSAAAPSFLSVSIAGVDVLVDEAPLADPVRAEVGVLTGTFVFPNGATGPLAVRSTASSPAIQLTEFVVEPEGAVNAFSTEDERGIAGLMPTGTDPPPAPSFELARFTGDGIDDFAALVNPGERLVLTRQALPADRTVLTSLRATGTGASAGLTCGVIYADGSEAQAACSPDSRGFAAQTYAPSAELPIAFFIEPAPAAPGPVLIDDVRLESCAMPCSAPSNAHATCASDVCDFECNPGYERVGMQCVVAGDQCGSAIDIPMAEHTVDLRASTIGAAHHVNGPCVSNGGADVIYRFTLTQPELVYADTFGASWDTVLFFASAGCQPVPVSAPVAGGLVECNDDAGSAGCASGGLQSQVLGFFQPGTHYLVLQGYGAAAGEAVIHFRHQPTGNGGASAAPYPAPQVLAAGHSVLSGALGGTGLVTTASMGLTSPRLGEYACMPGGNGPERSYFWRTCPDFAGGSFDASTCNGQTSADTYLHLSSPDAIAGNDCNDDNAACSTGLSSILPRPGTTDLGIAPGAGLHVLTVDSYSAGSSGAYVLDVNRP